MQSFTRKEIEWTAREMADKAGEMERIGEAGGATEIERGLARLRAEQYAAIADKLARAAADGDKRIAIRR